MIFNIKEKDQALLETCYTAIIEENKSNSRLSIYNQKTWPGSSPKVIRLFEYVEKLTSDKILKNRLRWPTKNTTIEGLLNMFQQRSEISSWPIGTRFLCVSDTDRPPDHYHGESTILQVIPTPDQYAMVTPGSEINPVFTRYMNIRPSAEFWAGFEVLKKYEIDNPFEVFLETYLDKKLPPPIQKDFESQASLYKPHLDEVERIRTQRIKKAIEPAGLGDLFDF